MRWGFLFKISSELLGVVALACATGTLQEDIVDVLEGLFKHGDNNGN